MKIARDWFVVAACLSILCACSTERTLRLQEDQDAAATSQAQAQAVSALVAASKCDIDIRPKVGRGVIGLIYDHDFEPTDTTDTIELTIQSMYTSYVVGPDLNDLVTVSSGGAGQYLGFRFTPVGNTMEWSKDKVNWTTWPPQWVDNKYSAKNGFDAPHEIEQNREVYNSTPRVWNKIHFDIAGASSHFWIVH